MGLKILITLIAGVFLFALQTGGSYLQHRRKIKASIQLILNHAKIALANIDSQIRNYQQARNNILKGDPFDEPEKNYTPLISSVKTHELSFEQVSEILRYLNKTHQELLLNYFAIQSQTDAMIDSVNSDFFRAMPQSRKAEAFCMLITATATTLKPAARELVVGLGGLVDELD